MARADDTELIDNFEEFYRSYYRNEIAELAQKYPNEQKSLYIDWQDLYRFDSDLADDFRNKPDQLREYAEEALRLYDLPVDVSLGQAHVRVRNLPEKTDIRGIRSDHRGMLISVQGIIRKATDVRPKITTAAFECQRCGTLTRIPQEGGDFQEPHECQGCERQGPFRINYDQSEFIDAQKLRVQESPEGLRGGETPQNIDVNIEDDITGEVTPGDHVTATGILKLEQQGNDREKSAMFDVYMEGLTIDIEDEQFEEMEITDEDKKEIVELSNQDNIYEEMVGAIAPSIYGYEKEKKAMAFQLFSGVTKFLPDGSRTRGDLHILLVGDPGTGKSQLLQYIKEIAPRSVYTSGKGSSSAGLCVTGDTLVHTRKGLIPIRELAEPSHPDPVDEETAAEYERRVYTFERDERKITERESSHVWRMPPKECRQIRTRHGKELETSTNTTLLVCGEQGLEWKEIADIEAGDHVAVPSYTNIERWSPRVEEFFEFTNEKLKPTDESVEFIRTRLCEEFGTLRTAASELELSEDFIYDSLSNRHLPQDKLDRILDAIGATRDDITIDRAMLRHGGSIQIPNEFDANLLYLVGLVFGDGDLMVSRRGGNRGHIRISNSNEEILSEAAEIIESTFDRSVEIEYQDDRVPCIRLHSATVARFFSNIGMETPKNSLELDHRLTTAPHANAFLRGLFDADGSVSARDDGGSSVQFSTICSKFAQQVQLMLETYGIRARRRERDRRGTYELETGRTIESKSVQTHLGIYGRDIEAYTERVGFRCTAKSKALSTITHDAPRRGERMPISDVLARTDGAGGTFYNNIIKEDDPSRGRAREMLADRQLGSAESTIEEVIEADLVWDEVVEAENTGTKELFDLTVPKTHNFLGNGIVTHNTAAAVRDDFGEGQQWTLEAGALVLADQGIAAVDELDKMRCVTGETLVHTPDRKIPIREFADRARESATVEELDNGRTIRGIDKEVWTMTGNEKIERRDVTAVHEYDAPDSLIEVTLESGESVTATPDHPFFVRSTEERTTKPAKELSCGNWVYVPQSQQPTLTDGGAAVKSRQPESGDVTWRQIEAIKQRASKSDEKVYDLTVDETHNFVANNVIIHNSEDQSAMHEALEQQSISVSKAGINATLKSRCSLLGAANPTYGRFDEFEPIGEQIDLAPPLISRFDLIFTVTDQPDEEKDNELAEHILQTNYAGELNTHRTETSTSNYTKEEVERITDDVAPTIDAGFLRKYVAYAQRNCYPTMTEEAKSAIQEFYVELRMQGSGEDAPVPVTARKLEAMVRLAEASARVRLSDSVTNEDAQRAIEIARYSLEDIGLDPETGELDADMIETGTSKSQRDRIKNVLKLIESIEDEYDEGAPVDVVIERAEEEGMDTSKAEHEIDQLKQKGEVYEPRNNHLRTT